MLFIFCFVAVVVAVVAVVVVFVVFVVADTAFVVGCCSVILLSAAGRC